jgi:alpha-N-arabinofuranosidase
MKPTSTLFYRQQHNNFSFTTTVEYKPNQKDLVSVVAYKMKAQIMFLNNKRQRLLCGFAEKSKTRRDSPINSTIVASAKLILRNQYSCK